MEEKKEIKQSEIKDESSAPLDVQSNQHVMDYFTKLFVYSGKKLKIHES